jgi:hypothetical protein
MKAVVHYKDIIGEPDIGKQVMLLPVDHTSPFVSNTKYILTSRVKAVHVDGWFETKNTHYQPYKWLENGK